MRSSSSSRTVGIAVAPAADNRHMTAAELVVDILGEPYFAETLELPADDEGEVVATLVSRQAPGDSDRRGAARARLLRLLLPDRGRGLLGERGYDFYALDLRKYGRSLRPHQTPNFALDLAEYYPELDLASTTLITERDGHDHVVLSGHSTGGADRGALAGRRRAAGGRRWCSTRPWLDLQRQLLAAHGGHQGDRPGRRTPAVPGDPPQRVAGSTAAACTSEYGGEWDFDLAWKPLESWPVFAGWLRAIRRGHAAVHRGLGLDAAGRSC